MILFISNHGYSQYATDVQVAERQALIGFQSLEEYLSHIDGEVYNYQPLVEENIMEMQPFFSLFNKLN